MTKRNILLVGSGGRECALAWKMKQSDLCGDLYIAPGNAGTISYGKNVDIGVSDFAEMKRLVLQAKISLVVVGPEAPLVEGIYDYFANDEALKEVMVIGPSAEGAQLEGSKAYAKKFMSDYHIPTAGYGEYTLDNLEAGFQHIDTNEGPYVLKADGLAAGKGVLIIQEKEEAKMELKAMLEGKFGAASSKVVIEDFLDGIEFSIFVLTDGRNYVILPEAKDYKKIGEGDTGLNTGGMGAVSPVPFYNDELAAKVQDRIVIPTIKGLQDRKITYKGFIFLGLIRVGNEPYVIEYNCRMGDPETEVVIPRIKNDLVELLVQTGERKLNNTSLEFMPEFAATIMLVSGGYPGSYKKGKTMSGMSTVKNSILFHAGTAIRENKVITNGGRVIALTSYGETMHDALAKAKQNAEKITFDGKYYRKDIGFDL